MCRWFQNSPSKWFLNIRGLCKLESECRGPLSLAKAGWSLLESRLPLHCQMWCKNAIVMVTVWGIAYLCTYTAKCVVLEPILQGKGMYSYLISLELSKPCHNANEKVNFVWNASATLYSKYSMNIHNSVKIRNSHSCYSSFEGALCLGNNGVHRVTLNTYFSWNSCPPFIIEWLHWWRAFK